MPVAVGVMADSYNKPAAGGGDPFTMVAWHVAAWASDPAWTPPADGAVVMSWRDGSGNARDLAVSPAANAPLYRAAASTLNNKPAVEFDGLDDWMGSPTFTGVGMPYTLVAVFRAATTASDRYALSAASVSAMGINTGKWKMYAGTTVEAGTPDTSKHFVAATFNGASSTVKVDGVQVLSGNVGTNTASSFRLATWAASVAAVGQNTYGFAGFKVGTLTAPEETALLAWSRSFYGTP